MLCLKDETPGRSADALVEKLKIRRKLSENPSGQKVKEIIIFRFITLHSELESSSKHKTKTDKPESL
jgi:hypothetical protein